jgi:hypothetical protein
MPVDPHNNIETLRNAGFEIPDNLSQQEVDFINGLTHDEITAVVSIARKGYKMFGGDSAIRRHPALQISFPL